VTIVDAGQKPPRSASRVPSRTRQAATADGSSGPASVGDGPAVDLGSHPSKLELIRSHTSTLIFVNSRRLAENSRARAGCRRDAGAIASRLNRASE
jgi:hypothetical protein